MKTQLIQLCLGSLWSAQLNLFSFRKWMFIYVQQCWVGWLNLSNLERRVFHYIQVFVYSIVKQLTSMLTNAPKSHTLKKQRKTHLTVSTFNWFAFIAVTENHQPHVGCGQVEPRFSHISFLLTSFSSFNETVWCNITSTMKYFSNVSECLMTLLTCFNYIWAWLNLNNEIKPLSKLWTGSSPTGQTEDQRFFLRSYSLDFQLNARDSLKICKHCIIAFH